MTIIDIILTVLGLVRKCDYIELEKLLDITSDIQFSQAREIHRYEYKIISLKKQLADAEQNLNKAQGIVQAQEKTIRNLQFRLVSCNAGIQPTKNQSTTPKQANPNAHLRSNNAPKWQQKQTVVVTR